MMMGDSVPALGTGADHGGDTSIVTKTAPVSLTARSTSDSASAPMAVSDCCERARQARADRTSSGIRTAGQMIRTRGHPQIAQRWARVRAVGQSMPPDPRIRRGRTRLNNSHLGRNMLSDSYDRCRGELGQSPSASGQDAPAGTRPRFMRSRCAAFRSAVSAPSLNRSRTGCRTARAPAASLRAASSSA